MLKIILSLMFAVSFSFSVNAETSWDDISKAEKSPENWVTHHGTFRRKKVF